MAYSKVQMEGNISFGKEGTPQLRNAGDTKVINFSVAIQQRKKEGDKWVNGETLWKSCEAWGKTAENIASSLKKGDTVVVIGEERADSFEKDGEKVTRDKVRVDSIGISLRWDGAESHRSPSGGGSYSNNSGGNSNGGGNRNSGGNSGGSQSSSNSSQANDNFDNFDFDNDLSGGNDSAPPF